MAIFSGIDSVARLFRDGLMSRMESMDRQINTIPDQGLLIASIAVILISTFGVSAVRAWVPGSMDRARSGLHINMLDNRVEDTESVGVRCPECGVVESRRAITQADGETFAEAPGAAKILRNTTSIKHYEVTLRMKDGTSRQFVDESATNAASATNVTHWRLGERVIVIGGTR